MPFSRTCAGWNVRTGNGFLLSLPELFDRDALRSALAIANSLAVRLPQQSSTGKCLKKRFYDNELRVGENLYNVCIENDPLSFHLREAP